MNRKREIIALNKRLDKIAARLTELEHDSRPQTLMIGIGREFHPLFGATYKHRIALNAFLEMLLNHLSLEIVPATSTPMTFKKKEPKNEKEKT